MHDTLSRLFMNDFFVNSYYLLWTSFWYLPTFLVVSFSLLLVNASKNGVGYFWLFIGAILVLISIHYQNLNLFNYMLDNCGSNFNTLLSNSVNKFHPALFYLTLFPLLTSLYLFVLSRHYKYGLNSNLIHNSCWSNWLIVVIIFTLFLGSWWALQEGSWGGWWNWDPSEVFGLFVMIYYLYTLHKLQQVSTYPIMTFYLKILIQLVLLTYVFIQLNFDLVSHNFGTKIDQFVDTSQNFLVTTVFLILLVTLNSNQLLKQLTSVLVVSAWQTLHDEKPVRLWHISLVAVIVFILLSSFSLLINDFLWKLLTINILNSAKFTYFYSSLLIVILLIRVWGAQALALLLPTYLIYFNKEGLIILIPLMLSKLGALHATLLSLLFVMLSESNQSTSFWEILYENASYAQESLSYDIGLPFVALNNFMIENLLVVLANGTTIESVWNFIWTASSNEGHSFLHSITPNSLTQSLYSGNGLSSYVINVLDFSISTSNLLITLVLVMMSHLLNSSKLITS